MKRIFPVGSAVVLCAAAMWIVTLVNRGSPDPPQASHADFDLVWDAVDDNGIPLNPEWWGWRANHTLPNPDSSCQGFPLALSFSEPSGTLGSPPCSTQPVNFDWPRGWYSSLMCNIGNIREGREGKFDGHVNWSPVTYTGTLYWEGHSNSVTDDDDYTFRLVPPGMTTLLPSNNGVFEVEFDSDETIDHFHTPWWEWLHDAVDNSDPSPGIDQSEAIVLGLLGIDTQHGRHTEIHPVWAMAIHDLLRQSPSDDVWAIFVRNWGDEGFCSSQQHYLELQTITLRLPWKAGATSVNSKEGTIFLFGPDDLPESQRSMVTGPAVAPAPGNAGVLVTFTLPPPRAHARINGELHLQWKGFPEDPCAKYRQRLNALLEELQTLTSGLPAPKANIPGLVEDRERKIDAWHRKHDAELADLRRRLAECVSSQFRPPAALAARLRPPSGHRRRNDPSEPGIAFLWNQMTESQRKTFLDRLPQKPSAKLDTLRPRPLAIGLPPGAPTKGKRMTVPSTSTEMDVKRQQLERQRFEALNAAFAGKIPGLPPGFLEKRAAIPGPGAFQVPGALEGEKLRVLGKSSNFAVEPQNMQKFPDSKWSGNAQLWGRPPKRGEWADLELPVAESGEYRVIVYLTKAQDYGIVRFRVNSKALGEPIDAFDAERVSRTDAIDLGTADLKKGNATLRVEVVDTNVKSVGARYMWGLDCVVLKPVGKP